MTKAPRPAHRLPACCVRGSRLISQSAVCRSSRLSVWWTLAVLGAHGHPSGRCGQGAARGAQWSCDAMLAKTKPVLSQ